MFGREQHNWRQVDSCRSVPGDHGLGKRWGMRPAALTVVALITVAMMSILVGYLLFVQGKPVGPNSDSHKSSSWRCVPEYNRRLKRVVLSVAKGNSSIELQDSLLTALPAYTKIILLLPESSVELIRRDLEDKPYRSRVQLVTYPAASLKNSKVWILFRDKDKLVEADLTGSNVENYVGNTWGQDMFEVVENQTGRTILLRSCVHKYWFTAAADSAAHISPDNTYLDRLSTVGMEVRTLPLAFMGGNIFIDEVDGEQVAFCGSDVLKNTRTVARAIHDANPSDAKTEAVIRNALKVDKVILLGAEQSQPDQMYHLDQAMLLLPDKVAAVAKIVGGRPKASPQAEEIKEAERFLAALRSTLRSLGYRLIDVETSAQNVLRCQHYVNAIPYVDVETGQRTLLMPTYLSAQTDFDKSLISKNTAVFESLGYKVIHVPTRADELRGGIHCLLNVID